MVPGLKNKKCSYLGHRTKHHMPSKKKCIDNVNIKKKRKNKNNNY